MMKKNLDMPVLNQKHLRIARYVLLLSSVLFASVDGLIDFSLAYTVMPDILNPLAQWSGLNFFHAPLFLMITAIITGVSIGFIPTAKMLMSQVLKYKTNTQNKSNISESFYPLMLKALIVSVSLALCFALFSEYQSHLIHINIFMHTHFVIGCLVVIGLLNFLISTFDRTSHFIKKELAETLNSLTFKKCIFSMLASIVFGVSLSNLMLNFIPFSFQGINIAYIASGALFTIILSLLLKNRFYSIWENQSISNKYKAFNIAKEGVAIILLLAHSAVEAGLASEGAKLIGCSLFNHQFPVTIMVATAFIFNFYLEVMVDGTEMLNHSEVNVESSKEEEDSKSLNINTLNHKSIEMKHYEMSKEYSKHFSKPYIRAISWGFGGFGALSLGLIGCLELQHAFMLPLPLCLILGGATLLVEQQFMAKQIERFLSKYIFLMLSHPI